MTSYGLVGSSSALGFCFCFFCPCYDSGFARHSFPCWRSCFCFSSCFSPCSRFSPCSCFCFCFCLCLDFYSCFSLSLLCLGWDSYSCSLRSDPCWYRGESGSGSGVRWRLLYYHSWRGPGWIANAGIENLNDEWTIAVLQKKENRAARTRESRHEAT